MRREPRGMTLIEVLVVLAVMSFVAALLAQALYQVARVERTLAGAQLEGALVAVRAAWVRGAIESMLPATRGSPSAFEGTERKLTGLSIDPPSMPELGLVRLTLSLDYDARRDLTSLRVVVLGSTQDNSLFNANPEAVERHLLSWSGQRGRFRYLGADGQWLNVWPPVVKDAPLLPKVVALETGLDDMPAIVAGLLATPVPLPTARELSVNQ